MYVCMYVSVFICACRYVFMFYVFICVYVCMYVLHGHSVCAAFNCKWTMQGSNFGRDKTFFFSPNRSDLLWAPPSLLFTGFRVFFLAI
jgi:hypothetical protein